MLDVSDLILLAKNIRVRGPERPVSFFTARRSQCEVSIGAVESFADSRLAWDSLRADDADVVVSDVSMPGLLCPDLVRLLRDNEATQDTPVVVLTGLHEADMLLCLAH